MKIIIFLVVIYILFSFFLNKSKPAKPQEQAPENPEPGAGTPDLAHDQTAPAESSKNERDSFMDLMGMGPESEPEPEPPAAQPVPQPETSLPPLTAGPYPIEKTELVLAASGPAVPQTRLYRNLTRQTLRDSIILAEILGPCLANRRTEQQAGNF
jgi:hypothetical protein